MQVLVGECLGGAMEVEAFKALAKAVGFDAPAHVSQTTIEVHDGELRALLGDAKFWSITWRLTKGGGSGGAGCCAGKKCC